jgi:hypothetical protein
MQLIKCNHSPSGLIFNAQSASMKIKCLLSAFLVFAFFISTQAQYVISGKVIDSASREPLSGASVFFQNTTMGTATNRQGEFSLTLRAGGYDLIISYTGYQSRTIRFTQTENVSLEIEMLKEEKSLEEVVIRSSNEVPDGWKQYGNFFVEHFIGTTAFAAQCTLENPEAVKFYLFKRSNKLKVQADEPLLIANHALGYNLVYRLDSFVYYYGTNISTYRGFCLYSEMEGSDEEWEKWEANRERAYFGSRLHFMRAYYDSTLAEEGFSIDLLDEENKTRFLKIDPYDTLYYRGIDSTLEIEIYFPRKFSVTYSKKRPEPEYLKKMGLPANVAAQISYIDLTDPIAIKENGYYYEQKSWINQGYWSWKNIADQLPYDYSPE